MTGATTNSSALLRSSKSCITHTAGAVHSSRKVEIIAAPV
ncbi:hypothetical protein MICA_365 [Micavibrio aeruginosavorus ARL-13]|uniref:Uncharacterized protein n=1 Tax=Micavibrio aeruginosavorus (strain ARL-13) TaxID=856793 RepID=G2KR58_MICAA|nr:hypothetical protein MICA_365 [Micavibrio aeruginosavorus ARL-13]